MTVKELIERSQVFPLDMLVLKNDDGVLNPVNPLHIEDEEVFVTNYFGVKAYEPEYMKDELKPPFTKIKAVVL